MFAIRSDCKTFSCRLCPFAREREEKEKEKERKKKERKRHHEVWRSGYDGRKKLTGVRIVILYLKSIRKLCVLIYSNGVA